jgi:hypothetical protein
MAFGDFTVDRNSTKYVLGSGGTIISYATDEPAFEFNADGSYKGLLVEPAATNICKQSEDISTTWLPNANTTPTQSTEETPDGDTSSKYIKIADNNTGGGATGVVQVEQTITVSGGTKYTASAFLKKDGLNWARLQASGTGGSPDSGPFQYFDLDNGVLGTGSAGIQAATIEAYPNDWYRCSITWTQGAADTSFVFLIYPSDADNDVVVDLDGTSSIFVWGAQVETGPIATSYIPTASAAVTRVKDDITQTGAQSLIGQTEGTLYLEVDWRLASGTEQYLLSVNDGTNSNRMLIYNSSGVLLQIYVEAGGAFIAGGGESSSAYSGIQKFAFAYADGDFELYRNGSSISSTGGSLAALATMTDIDLGQRYDASAQANMHIRAVALYPTRLGAVELEVLTGAPTYGSYALMASSLGYTVE